MMLNFNLQAVTGYISDVIHGRDVFVGDKKARWTKVESLNVGDSIATLQNDETVGFDEVVSIKAVGREQVWDIEVEGSRNFVGNGILAHNTYLHGTSATIPVASISASTNFAGMVVDNTIGDLFTASSSGLNRFVITQNGNVGIGTTGPAALLSLANANFTTQNMLNVAGTATGLTTGSLANFDWSPTAWSTSSGNLVNINLGSLADTTGNIFNISDDGSSIFSVSPQQSVFGIPTSFNAAGDVAIAYDINFTNPTASYLKSAAPLYLQAGELFNSSDLNLTTFNKGNIIFNSEATLVNGAATVSGQLMVGTTTAAPAQFGKFLVTDSNTATSSAFIENSNTAAGIVGLTMKLGSTTLDTTSHFVNFLDLNGKRIGSIRAANTTTVAYQTSGIADFGEYMKRDSSFSDPATLSPGTVTCFGSDGIKPCESGDTAKIVGVASDTTAFVGGDEKPENTIVGFLGQIKVKVATDSGSIAVGDPIGVGTGGRARKLAGRGYAVGMAIEPWTLGQDKVLVYVNPGYYEGARDQGLGTRKSIDELQAQIASLSGNLSSWENATISGDLKVLGLTELANTNIGGSLQVGLLHFDDVNAEISSLTGMVTIDGELTAKKFNVSGDSAGKATILSGQTEIEITTSALNTNSLIFATPEDTPVPVSTTKTAANKFKIKLANPAAANIKVSWWIVN